MNISRKRLIKDRDAVVKLITEAGDKKLAAEVKIILDKTIDEIGRIAEVSIQRNKVLNSQLKSAIIHGGDPNFTP
jgi:hypothetical protein